MKKFLFISTLALSLSFAAEGKNLRAPDITAADWKALRSVNSSDELTVEFRKGDEIPIQFTATGDFFESKSTEANILVIKQNFWLQLKKDQLLASLDGEHYRPLGDVVTGQLSANAGAADSNTPVNAIQVLLSAFMK